MLETQGVEGKGVVSYYNPLTMQEMRYPLLSQRVNKPVNLMLSMDFTNGHGL
jgi:hypothetical protein